MFVFGGQTSGPELKSRTTRYRRYWDTVGLEVLWSRACRTVSDKGPDLELYVLAKGKPVKGVSVERRDMGELCNAPMRRAAALRTA